MTKLMAAVGLFLTGLLGCILWRVLYVEQMMRHLQLSTAMNNRSDLHSPTKRALRKRIEHNQRTWQTARRDVG